MAWPDIVIGAILLLALLKGYKRGFILELSGTVAMILAFITPWFYGGVFDRPLQRALHVGPGSAHVIGMFVVGVATYAAVLLAARVLNVVAKLPVLGFGNALGGAAVGLFKGAVLVWLILYVALFFPLSRDLRHDLHRSRLAALLTAPNGRIDDALSATLPWFARPLMQPVFRRHHV
jgi:membrane protein required for colicin V production